MRIQLSKLDFHDVNELFSRNDLHESDFQETIIKVLSLGKCFQLLIKEKLGLSEGDKLTEQQILFTIKEETDMLDDEGMKILQT
jgi:hypothetical protein